MLDAVITYVDSTDKSWRKEYSRFVKRPLEEVENRFRSFNCLDLQIKLIRKNMDFVDNVFVIVSSESQVPDNVKSLDRVHIVTHDKIIPKRYLPCFNSCAIEMFMYNIKDLKEHFIYFNDDMFVISKCEETDFVKDGKLAVKYDIKKYVVDEANAFEMNVINAHRLIDKNATEFIKPYHFCLPLNKYHIQGIWIKNSNDIEKSLTRTRHRMNINFYAFVDYEIINKNFIETKLKTEYFTTLDDIEFEYNKLIENGTQLICINDAGIYDDKYMDMFRLMLECFLEDKKFVESKKEIERKQIIKNSKIVVTMTSWRNRIFLVNDVIRIMLNQTLVPTKIVLNLSEDEFKHKEKDLPKDLVSTIERNSNICEIYWVKENYKQFKKLVHTLDRYPNDIIISIDDDFPYPRNFVETLFNDYIDNNRENPISYSNYVDKDGFHTHHGSFTITESKFYEDYLHEILEKFVYPNFNNYKCYDDPVYTEAARLNGYDYKEGSVNYNKFRLNLHSETVDALSKRTKTYSEKRNKFISDLKEFCEKIKPINPKVAVCAIAKNENLYIREWVEWYKNLGIEKIFLYDNNDINGERFEEVINDYIESGFVEVIDRRGVEKEIRNENKLNLQDFCYIEWMKNNYMNFNWVCYVDCDEFLTIENCSLFQYLNKKCFRNINTILLNWKNYGDSDNVYYENKPVQERFTIPAPNIKWLRSNYQCKSIVRCSSDKILISNKNTIIHKFLYENYNVADSNGNNINSFVLESKTNMPYLLYDNAYIKHYVTKTIEEYLNRYVGRFNSNISTMNKRLQIFGIDEVSEHFFKINKRTKEKEKIIEKYKKTNPKKIKSLVFKSLENYNEYYKV